MVTLAETSKMQGKLATRVLKSVLILAAKHMYKFITYFSHGWFQVFTPLITLT